VSLAIQFPFIVSDQGLSGSPKFLDASLCTCHSLMTPGILHTLTKTGASVLTSVYVKTLVDSKFSFRSCTNFQVLRTPCGLHNSLCTLHPFCSSLEAINYRFDSAMGATLDMGGGLGLTQQGLSPCKMHQASLGALTIRLLKFLRRHRQERCLTGNHSCLQNLQSATATTTDHFRSHF